MTGQHLGDKYSPYVCQMRTEQPSLGHIVTIIMKYTRFTNTHEVVADKTEVCTIKS